MKSIHFPNTGYSGMDHGRRRLLGGLLSAYTATLIPWAVA